MRTQQALRQAIYTRLTSPALSYTINNGNAIELPTANVIPRSVWLTGGDSSPSPLVAFSVSTSGTLSRFLDERKMSVRFWVVSTSGPDECSEIYEAIRARIHQADDIGQPWDVPDDLGRVPGDDTLPLVVRNCAEMRVSDIDFDASTSRYSLVAEYGVVAL